MIHTQEWLRLEKNRFEIKNDDDVVLPLTRLTHSAKCDPCHEIETELRAQLINFIKKNN